jgi:hypothetical protein
MLYINVSKIVTLIESSNCTHCYFSDTHKREFKWIFLNLLETMNTAGIIRPK